MSFICLYPLNDLFISRQTLSSTQVKENPIIYKRKMYFNVHNINLFDNHSTELYYINIKTFPKLH